MSREAILGGISARKLAGCAGLCFILMAGGAQAETVCQYETTATANKALDRTLKCHGEGVTFYINCVGSEMLLAFSAPVFMYVEDGIDIAYRFDRGPWQRRSFEWSGGLAFTSTAAEARSFFHRLRGAQTLRIQVDEAEGSINLDALKTADKEAFAAGCAMGKGPA